MSEGGDPDGAHGGVESGERSDSSPARVRVRGIYATALTALLREAGHEVVQASPPIRERFEGEFPLAPHEARAETTTDRQGVEISGTESAVGAVRDELGSVARDAFDWPDAVPRGAVFDALLDRDVGGGAVLDLGEGREAYLPYDSVDDYVETGDCRRVQIRTPEPPWSDDRALAVPGITATGGPATLVRGADAAVVGTPDGTAEHELARLTDLLPTDVPEGWGVRWSDAADDAEMDALDGALAAAADRAAAIDEALAESSDPDPDTAPRAVVAPGATAWIWFGRECRFALDDVREGVTATMAGHHRTKAAAAAASDAVDFLERVSGAVEPYPLAAVLDQFGPAAGDRLAIEHGKPDGRLITLGRGEVTDVDSETGTITVRRQMTGGGTYDALEVPRERGDTAVTKFREGRWWYPTVYRGESGAIKGTYCNVCTPVELFPAAARYVDLHVDVIKHADGEVAVVDEAELAAAVEAGDVPPEAAERARAVARQVGNALG
jgi:hypothetical protein